MAQFKLIWNNSVVAVNPNAISQRAYYRQKTIGGVFISTGFTPANDLPKTASTANTPVLLNNIVYEFKVQSICTENGPTDNDNGIVEKIGFSCIVPILSKTSTTTNITFDVSTTDITKARLTLRRSSDNSIIYQQIINNSGGLIETMVTGLTPSTGYYWQAELYATVGGEEKISSSVDNLGSTCGPYIIVTDAPSVCDPVISITVNSVEIV
jgi:hypothetical protein